MAGVVGATVGWVSAAHTMQMKYNAYSVRNPTSTRRTSDVGLRAKGANPTYGEPNSWQA